MKFHEIWRNFMILRIFHISGEILPFLVFWSVSSPPGELKNLNIPIGITRFWACGGQGTYRILQKWFLHHFTDFPGILLKWWNFGDFQEINGFFWIFRFLGVQAAQTLILSKEYKGFVKGRGILQINEFHEISWFSWNFHISIDFLEFQWKFEKTMKIMKLHENHWFPGFRDPSRNLCIPCSKSRSERLQTPQT